MDNNIIQFPKTQPVFQISKLHNQAVEVLKSLLETLADPPIRPVGDGLGCQVVCKFKGREVELERWPSNKLSIRINGDRLKNIGKVNVKIDHNHISSLRDVQEAKLYKGQALIIVQWLMGM